MPRDCVAIRCAMCRAVLPVCSSESAADMRMRHLARGCSRREDLPVTFFLQLYMRCRLLDAHWALWRGQWGLA